MFTLEQVDALHTRLGKADMLGAYARALRALGVETYDTYLRDGHSAYRGWKGYEVVSKAVYERLPIAETVNEDGFFEQLQRHERGETSYLEMTRGLAASGVEKWTVDTTALTLTFFDTAGRALLIESLE